MASKNLMRTFLLLFVVASLGAMIWSRIDRPATPAAEQAALVATATETAEEPGSASLATAQEPAGPQVPNAQASAKPRQGVAAQGAVAAQAVAAVTPSAAPDPQTAKMPEAPAKSAQALYLHGNFRCETCRSIEDQAKRAITEDFASQIRDGKLEFAAINIDKEPNTHFGDDFQLTSASLVLTDGKGPKGHWKVLDRTWELVRDPAAFREYVDAETRTFLDGGR